MRAGLLTPDGRLARVNSQWTSLHRPTPAAGPDIMPGALYPDSVSVRSGWPAPHAKRVVAGLTEVLGRQRESHDQEYSCDSREGRLWFRARCKRIGTNPEWILVTHENITARKRAEEALHRSQARLRNVVTGAPIVLFSTDEDGVFTLVEGVGAQNLGMTPEQLIGRSVFEVYSHMQGMVQAIRGALAGQNMTAVVQVGRVTLEVRCSPSHAENGQLEGVVGVASDITERRRIERLKDEFVSIVSHELRTPLTSIRGSLGLLEGGAVKAESDKGRELVRIARSNTERLIRLINDILDLDKIEAGKLSFKNEELEPQTIVEQAVASIAGLARDQHVSVATQVADVPKISGDPDRLVQVLTNLLSNAVKFSPAGSTVMVAVEATDKGFVHFSVRDQGPGIPADQLDQLFKKFQQLEVSQTRKSGGSGLGLAISRAIVSAHRGTIGVDSTPGKGSDFHFELPHASHVARSHTPFRSLSDRRDQTTGRFEASSIPKPGEVALPEQLRTIRQRLDALAQTDDPRKRAELAQDAFALVRIAAHTSPQPSAAAALSQLETALAALARAPDDGEALQRALQATDTAL